MLALHNLFPEGIFKVITIRAPQWGGAGEKNRKRHLSAGSSWLLMLLPVPSFSSQISRVNVPSSSQWWVGWGGGLDRDLGGCCEACWIIFLNEVSSSHHLEPYPQQKSASINLCQESASLHFDMKISNYAVSLTGTFFVPGKTKHNKKQFRELIHLNSITICFFLLPLKILLYLRGL